VLATYGGKPEWLEIGNLQANSKLAEVRLADQQVIESFGLLSLSGKEKIFAVDGQHRLAGIKRAIEDGYDFGEERLPVIFIAHSEKKRERTRRLFTTLNKTARPVKKADIIALDEDDSMAIVSRRLVESHDWFTSPKISITSNSALPATNRVALTTIVNLYDILKLVFKFRDGVKDEMLRFYRPSDSRLDDLYEFAIQYFTALSKAFPPVKALFQADEPASVTQKHRGNSGGHLLFRPAGLEIFTRVAIAYATQHGCSLIDAVDAMKGIPTDLSARPFRDVLWDSERRTMVLAGRRLSQDLLRHIVRLGPAKDDELLERYRVATKDAAMKLPRRLAA
jgi:DNA sulfur modification protein DndB